MYIYMNVHNLMDMMYIGGGMQGHLLAGRLRRLYVYICTYHGVCVCVYIYIYVNGVM